MMTNEWIVYLEICVGARHVDRVAATVTPARPSDWPDASVGFTTIFLVGMEESQSGIRNISS